MNDDRLTVLVVDDELPIRQELRLFSWEEHQFEWIGEAENGEEALRFCRSFVPDIVVTDITMPVMDGLALFRSLKAEFPHIQVILLTCHSDFAYAKEAIKLGAVEYLVKVTMDDRDLAQALHRAKEGVYREQSLQRGEAESRRWKTSERLLEVSRQAADDNELAIWLQDAFRTKLPLQLTALHVEASREGKLFVHHAVEDSLRSLEQVKSFSWIPADSGVYVLVFRGENGDLPELRSEMEWITNELYQSLDRRFAFLSDTYRLYSVLSEPIGNSAAFVEQYRVICRRPDTVFYESASRVIEMPLPDSSSLDEQSAADMSVKLNKAQWNREQLAALIRGGFAEWAISRAIVPEELRTFVSDWLRDWHREQAAQGVKGRKASSRINDAATLNELAEAFVQAIELPDRVKKCRKEITDAKAFIEENLDKPITLGSVSKEVGLSPHYLSRLFREETGIPFNDFVTGRRIEKATDLLQHTSLRVYEIAQQVGIPSYRYFSAIFREWTGAAPTDLRTADKEGKG
ncbi:response regulator [Paenibacillus sacheonensis]|uniref:Response regulator n=1 Tax=Paenibacillus sacheonensis TaxID=742054 RepID=A0A7X4YUT0_9BACL|nr:response regulator [Paenibacillus sacheonensis]MBM7567750.1 two-component system response regulator YesN [Paenibacillus sacheonensis]NBC71976.1 response regulator [Paenibacillus sacheonensis]